jgi:hypothetical protein
MIRSFALTDLIGLILILIVGVLLIGDEKKGLVMA